MKRFAVDGGPIRVFASLRLVTRGASMDFKQFYLSADGRVNRKQWWLYLILPAFIISIIASIIDASTGHDPQQGIGPITAIFSLLILYPSIVVYIKRFHDRDKSGWWVLIALIPIIGAIWLLIECGFLKGTPGPNRFGPPVTD
jgi:uncharacterized membrane protein YhaH (DUF805 family)